MPYLDVYRLFFDPIALIEDESTVFGKQWRMTLEFILHQAGLRATYSSRLGTESDLWVFLRRCLSITRAPLSLIVTSLGI